MKSSANLVGLCLCGAIFGVVVGIDLLDNSRCLREGSICETSAECCSGELSTLCSHGRCRCWSGMKWNDAMRRCVPAFTFRFGSLDLDVEEENDLFYLRNRNHDSGPSFDGAERTNVNKNGDMRVEKPRDEYETYRPPPPPPPPPEFGQDWAVGKPTEGSSSFQNVVSSKDKLDVQRNPDASGSQRAFVSFPVASCLVFFWLLET